MNAKDITEAYRRFVDEGDETPTEINSGLCADAADIISQRLTGHIGEPRPFDIVGTPFGTLSHTWIHYNGLHFDVEAPEGVAHASELPIFKRYRESLITGEYDPVSTQLPERRTPIGEINQR